MASLRRRHVAAIAENKRGRDARAMELGLTEIPDSELVYEAAAVAQGQVADVLSGSARSSAGRGAPVVGESVVERLRTRVRKEDGEGYRLKAQERAEEGRKTGGKQVGPGAFTLSPAGRMSELHAGMPSDRVHQYNPYDANVMAQPAEFDDAGDMRHPGGRLNAEFGDGELSSAHTTGSALDGMRGPQVENVTNPQHAPYGDVSTWNIEDPDLAMETGDHLRVAEVTLHDAVQEMASTEYDNSVAEGSTAEEATQAAAALDSALTGTEVQGVPTKFVGGEGAAASGSQAPVAGYVVKAPRGTPAMSQLSTALDTDPEGHIHDEARRSRARAYADALDALHNRRAPLLV